jgi:F0F1-type ATP synthase membrane subunit a
MSQKILYKICVISLGGGGEFMVLLKNDFVAIHALWRSAEHILIYHPVSVLLQCVFVRLVTHLSDNATTLCTRRLALVYEMLAHIRLVKMTTMESVLSQRVTGKPFIAVTAVTGLYIVVPNFNKSLLFLQGLDTRNWVSQGSSTSVTCSALP